VELVCQLQSDSAFVTSQTANQKRAISQTTLRHWGLRRSTPEWLGAQFQYNTNEVLIVQDGASLNLTNLPTNHEFSIGSRQSGSGSSYDYPLGGLLDDVRVYNRALAASDVHQRGQPVVRFTS